MPSAYRYDKIEKFVVRAELTEPMHVGGSSGDPEEVLVHPADGMPFVQASGIAGAFRACGDRNDRNIVRELFGCAAGDEGTASRLVFTDGRFSAQKDGGLRMEFRPRVKINPETGSVDSGEGKGTGRSSGFRFNTEYVGAGSLFEFTVYLFTEDGREELHDALMKIFAALNEESLQLSGQKSNGCGYMRLQHLYCAGYDMRSAEDRVRWSKEAEEQEKDWQDICGQLPEAGAGGYAYRVILRGKTEGSLLVKGIIAESADDKEHTPDASNIRNAKGDFIIPGSSLKGVIRNRMEYIADYLGQNSGADSKSLIEDAFGRQMISESGKTEETGFVGNLHFRDTSVGTKEANEKVPVSHRIHIDKFTGGVMHGALFTQRTVYGDITFTIDIINCNHQDRTLGLLLMALRDLAAGRFNIGSGYNIGHGFIDVDTITVYGPGMKEMAVIDMHREQIKDQEGLLGRCMSSLQGKELS